MMKYLVIIIVLFLIFFGVMLYFILRKPNKSSKSSPSSTTTKTPGGGGGKPTPIKPPEPTLHPIPPAIPKVRPEILDKIDIMIGYTNKVTDVYVDHPDKVNGEDSGFFGQFTQKDVTNYLNVFNTILNSVSGRFKSPNGDTVLFDSNFISQWKKLPLSKLLKMPAEQIRTTDSPTDYLYNISVANGINYNYFMNFYIYILGFTIKYMIQNKIKVYSNSSYIEPQINDPNNALSTMNFCIDANKERATLFSDMYNYFITDQDDFMNRYYISYPFQIMSLMNLVMWNTKTSTDPDHGLVPNVYAEYVYTTQIGFQKYGLLNVCKDVCKPVSLCE